MIIFLFVGSPHSSPLYTSPNSPSPNLSWMPIDQIGTSQSSKQGDSSTGLHATEDMFVQDTLLPNSHGCSSKTLSCKERIITFHVLYLQRTWIKILLSLLLRLERTSTIVAKQVPIVTSSRTAPNDAIE